MIKDGHQNAVLTKLTTYNILLLKLVFIKKYIFASNQF